MFSFSSEVLPQTSILKPQATSIFAINPSQIVQQNFVGAATIEQELGISPESLRRIFAAKCVSTVNPHRLFDGVHAHLCGVIFGHHALIRARDVILNHPGTSV